MLVRRMRARMLQDVGEQAGKESPYDVAETFGGMEGVGEGMNVDVEDEELIAVRDTRGSDGEGKVNFLDVFPLGREITGMFKTSAEREYASETWRLDGFWLI